MIVMCAKKQHPFRCSQMLECKGLEERLVLFLFEVGGGGIFLGIKIHVCDKIAKH